MKKNIFKNICSQESHELIERESHELIEREREREREMRES